MSSAKSVVAGSCLAVLCALFLTGCGDKSGKILGHWKSQDGQGGWHSLLVFDKNSMTLDEARSDTAMETRDGKVVVRRAGTDHVLALVTIVDGNALDVEVDNRKTRYVRSSPDEHARLLAASPREKILGFWKTPNRMVGGYSITEIGPDYLRDDGGDPVPLAREMRDGKLVLLRPDQEMPGPPPVVTLHGDDRMELASPWGVAEFERVAPETARRLLSPEPEMAVGFWLAGDDVLELTADSMNLNGVARPIALRAGRKAVVATEPDDEDAVVARFLVGEGDTIALETGVMSRNLEFSRIPEDEARSRLDGFAAKAASVIGTWMSEEPESYGRRGRNTMTIAADSFTRDGKTTPARIQPTADGVHILSLERVRPLAELTILGPDKVEMDSGGFMGGKTVYLRTTPETLALLERPAPEQALGAWVAEEGTDWLPHLNTFTLTASSLSWNGMELPAVLGEEEGQIVVKGDNRVHFPMGITFQDADRILLHHPSLREAVFYRRAREEEAGSVVAAYQKKLRDLYGMWLSEKDGYGFPGGRARLELTENEIVSNNDKRQRYQPAFFNGEIHFIDSARGERAFGVIEIADNNTIRHRFGMSYDGTFFRSSVEEVDALVNPRPETVYGYWLSEKTNAVDLPIGLLVFTPDKVMVDFDTLPAEYASGNGRLVAQSPDRKSKLVEVRRIEADRIVLADHNSTVYRRVEAEAFQQALLGYQKVFQDNVMGYWKMDQVGGKLSVVHITRNRAVQDTLQPLENFKIGMRHGQFQLSVEGRNSVTVEVLGPGRIRYNQRATFVPASEEEYKQLLALWQ